MNPSSCSTTPSQNYIDVSVHKDEQTLIYFPGDGEALFLPDSTERDDLLRYVGSPVARAVLAARLRAFADMLEPSLLDGLTAEAVAR